MPYNEIAKKATAKYIKEKRDQLNLNLPKGKKEEYKKYAKSKGVSLTAYITKLIEKDMEEQNNDR
jgi:predicted DNA binding CopG/RHH family protein